MHPEHAVSVDREVPFHHCDPLFVVWHGRYFEYLEEARTELLRSRGLDVPDIRDLGYRMYVTDARCRYTHPMSYGDHVRVTAWFTAISPLLRVAYEIRNLTRGRRTARAYTVLSTLDADGNLLTEPPDEVRRRLPL